ncbi:MAG: nucleotidyltransferase domain-containing protein [Candidatus Tectomicrobia bacterium]|nr:nucleotidyltransferase domain-containing protein [Candidatus Tectomicrobia bacterium]
MNLMKSLDKQAVLEIAERCRAYLIEHYGVKRVIVFGSVRRNGTWHDRSDLDLAVEGLAPEVFFRAYSELQKLLPSGLVVDLVPLEDTSPELRARILREIEMPDSPIEALRGLIEDELATLGRVVNEMEELLSALGDSPTRTELRAMASILHDFYNSIENIFERIAVHLGEGLPKGEYWHTDLLSQMATEQGEKRKAVIDEPLRALLKEYLDFRHFFRHAYGLTLEWKKIRLLAEGMRGSFEKLHTQMGIFFEGL